MNHDAASPDTGARTGGGLAPLFAGYWAFGQSWGASAVLLDDFMRHHGFAESRMGWLFAGLAVVSIGTMLLLAPRLRAPSLATTVPGSLVVMGVGAILTAVSPAGLMMLPFAVLGIGNGLIDVFMNVAGQDLEARSGRPVLQRMHAGYSVGGISGGLGTGLALQAGGDFRWILVATGLALFAAAAWNRAAAPPDVPMHGASESLFSLSAFRRTPALLVPGIVVLFAFLVEGSMDTWSGIYLRRTLGASPLATGIGFAAFAGAMAIGRFLAAAIFKLGYRMTIMLSGLGSLAAGIVVVLTNSIWVANGAYLFLGFALASAAPAAFGLTQRTDEHPTDAIAAITTLGYTGFVFAPPLLGWLGSEFGLRATMGFMLLATVGVVVGGILTPGRSAPPEG